MVSAHFRKAQCIIDWGHLPPFYGCPRRALFFIGFDQNLADATLAIWLGAFCVRWECGKKGRILLNSVIDNLAGDTMGMWYATLTPQN